LHTEQEWCHLLGHGDGGAETFDNFVSGSHQANTLQLAIETGQRADGCDKLSARITAYLFNGVVLGQTNNANVIAALQKIGVNYAQTKSSEEFVQAKGAEILQKLDAANNTARDAFWALLKVTDVGFKSGIFDQSQSQSDKRTKYRQRLLKDIADSFFVPLPFAEYIRYKVYYRRDGKDIKIFDAMFDAQAESIDVVECRIIDYGVRAQIAQYVDVDAKNDGKEPIARQGYRNFLQTAGIRRAKERAQQLANQMAALEAKKLQDARDAKNLEEDNRAIDLLNEFKTNADRGVDLDMNINQPLGVTDRKRNPPGAGGDSSKRPHVG
jgi:hypothetical protein